MKNQNRFRHMTRRQLVGLYLLMQAVAKGKTSVHLSNQSLCALLRVNRVHPGRVKELASSFAPFLVGYKIHDLPGTNRTVTFFLPGTEDWANSLKNPSIPSREVMENALRLKVKNFETETKTITLYRDGTPKPRSQ